MPLSPASASTAADRSGADTVLRGGRIHLLDESGATAEAIAIRDGVVTATDGDALRQRGARTTIVELGGRTAIPGINDAHLHAAWLGARWPRLFFGGEHSHAGDDETLLTTAADRRRALLIAWRLLAERGITSYTEPGIGPGENDGATGCFGEPMLETYLDLHRSGAQTARVTLLRLFGELDGESRVADVLSGIRSPAPRTDPRWLAITGTKIFGDGIPPMRSAWVSAPYDDGSTGGLLTRGADSDVAAFRTMVTASRAAGHQVAVHATGDRTIEAFLDAVEASPDGGAPPYVVHADLITPRLIERARRAGVGMSMQPLIAEHTGEWAGGRLGADRVRAAWPLREALDSGALVTLTSDAPIADPDWRLTLDAALRLCGEDDRPTRERVLRACTVDAARQDGASEWKGSLVPGRVADLVVLDEDPLETGRPFTDAHVQTTMVAGRAVFERDAAL